MVSRSEGDTSLPGGYGSARDLPSYRELAEQIRGFKTLTRIVARDQRKQIIEIEQDLNRLVEVADGFYERLGARNWIFHDSMNVGAIEKLLADTDDAASAEAGLIDMYRDPEVTGWWVMRLRNHDGLRQRAHQIDRAREHYEAGQFDSCVMHLIAVMDGFVNDFDPGQRKGLHSREPDQMAAWDSVVGHHMGLSHVMRTFTKTIKKRMDDEVFDVYRHGIMHGTVVRFDNVVVATKAWNLLFAVADWATATRKASEPQEAPATWRDVWSSVSRSATRRRHERQFQPRIVTSEEPEFGSDRVALIASEMLQAWQHHRWGLLAQFKPPVLGGGRSDGQNAMETKATFERIELSEWSIKSVAYRQTSSAEIEASAMVNGSATELRFRMLFWTDGGEIGIPDQDDGSWALAVWAPHTYLPSPDQEEQTPFG